MSFSLWYYYGKYIIPNVFRFSSGLPEPTLVREESWVIRTENCTACGIGLKKKCIGGYKPDSVLRCRHNVPDQIDDHLSKRSTRNLYLAKRHGQRLIPYSTLLRKGFTLRFGFHTNPVGSYPTFSPLPRTCGAVFFLWHYPSRGI